ncbi:hypothetical protein BD779DRAFT_1570132 [Infundibulicybe gibba]|nr:hypothetical protein BD779DRAFT_1570132 [Infundibulicybe gibba]
MYPQTSWFAFCHSGKTRQYCFPRELPEADAGRKECENILEGLEPQLTELSDSIFSLVRVLGAIFATWEPPPGSWRQPRIGRQPPFSPEAVGWLIDYPKTLDLSFLDLDVAGRPITKVYQALIEWLSSHRQLQREGGFLAPAVWNIHGPPRTLSDYTWAWPWNTCQFLPLNPTPLLAHQVLKHASESLVTYDISRTTSALPTLNTTCYPRLFYLHRAFDGLFWDVGLARQMRAHPLRDHLGFLSTMYSQLLQDPVASRTTPILYAINVACLAPGTLCRSASMQALFGVGVGPEGEGKIRVSSLLPAFLKKGLVEFRRGQPNGGINENNSDDGINKRMRDAHERLAIACSDYLASYAESVDWDDPTALYAMKYRTSHITRAKHSENLFQTLRWINISRYNIEPIIQWFEESPDTPEDVLLRWYVARVNHRTMYESTQGTLDPGPCLLDQAPGARGHSAQAANLMELCYLEYSRH